MYTQILLSPLRMHGKFPKHRLQPKVIDELRPQNSKDLSDTPNMTDTAMKRSGIYIMRNHTCDLFSDDAYIVRYIKSTNENRSYGSLIPVSPLRIVHITEHQDSSIMKDVKRALEGFYMHHDFYECPLQRLVRTVEDTVIRVKQRKI